jgi:AraC-like DNA-binding protein
MPHDLPDHVLIDMLTTRPMVAFEGSEEGVRDNGAHHHRAGQLLGSTNGLLSVSTSRGNWVVPATHCVWIPPRQEHSVRSHGPFSGWSIYITEDSSGALPDAPRTMRTTGLLREAMHRLATLPAEPPYDRHFRLADVIIDEFEAMPTEQLGLAMPSDPRLAKIANALMKDVAIDLNLVDWARWGNISARTLSRRFVQDTGFTFTAWRQRARLLRALELLAQGAAVTTVSMELGYDNIGAFIALFRRTYGCTPREYAKGQVADGGSTDADGSQS